MADVSGLFTSIFPGLAAFPAHNRCSANASCILPLIHHLTQLDDFLLSGDVVVTIVVCCVEARFVEVKNLDSGTKLPRFDSWLCDWLPM